MTVPSPADAVPGPRVLFDPTAEDPRAASLASRRTACDSRPTNSHFVIGDVHRSTGERDQVFRHSGLLDALGAGSSPRMTRLTPRSHRSSCALRSRVGESCPPQLRALVRVGGVRVASGDLSLHVAEDGDPLAPPVLLVHGIVGSRSTWSWLVPELVERFRVLRLDLRGHGQSDRAPGRYTADGYVADAIATVEQAAGGRVSSSVTRSAVQPQRRSPNAERTCSSAQCSRTRRSGRPRSARVRRWRATRCSTGSGSCATRFRRCRRAR